jgi:hypothetical protein
VISIKHALKDQKIRLARELALFSTWLFLSRFLRPFRNLCIKRIRILYDKTYIIALDSHEVSKNYTQMEAYECLPVIKATIAHFNRLRSRLEKVDYLGSKELELRSNLLLDALYDLDIPIRSKAFLGLQKKSTDPRIISCLAEMSKNAIESRLNRQ